jgi:secreted trypsin-like serine protease
MVYSHHPWPGIRRRGSATYNFWKFERDAKALGWGNVIPTTKYDSDPDNEDSLSPKKLREVDLTIIRDSLCSKSERMSNLYGKDWITDNMICTGDGLGTKDACDGDSGGPPSLYQ